MKTMLLLALPGAALGCFTGCASVDDTRATPPEDGRVQVNFENPENFTDVRRYFGQRFEEGYLGTLERFLNREARRHLAPDQTLSMTFRDIDMAGDFEPWRGSNLQDVRIVKNIYPPRLVFTYTVTDENGEIVHEGQERLSDLAFTMRVDRLDQGDTLYHEKELLRDWMARALR
jgi:hypothetical protein